MEAGRLARDPGKGAHTMSSPAIASSAPATDLPIRRIRLWQHWRAVGQMERAYPPGADTVVDELRSAHPVVHFAFRHLAGPLYFAREQGWMVRGLRGEMAAIMHLRPQERDGVRVVHVDDINVSARYLRRGLAQRLLGLAEELAHKERRPYLKLAVTVTNTPAVMLYRRLGYQDQHYRFFTLAPRSVPPQVEQPHDLILRRLSRKQAAQAYQRFYRLEMLATVPAVADVMVTYYARGGSGVSGLRSAQRGYAIEQSGQDIGYGDVYRQKGQWKLRLSLRPELWATEAERQAIELLTGVIGRDNRLTVTLNVPSAGHFDALASGPAPLAQSLGLSEQSAARMIMVKPLGTQGGPRGHDQREKGPGAGVS
jgi:ribosomal protein S18 acetylase RimI-like enzyme